MADRRSRLSWLWSVLVALVASAWVIETSPGFIARMASAYVAVFVVSIFVHEVGHAVAASLVRFRVMKVVTGAGPRVLSLNVGRTEFELRLLPLGGVTHIGGRDPHAVLRGVRVRHFVAVAAGPVATIALAVWGADLVPGHWGVWTVTDRGVVTGDSYASMLAWLNTGLAIVNLFPKGGSDGAILWSLLTSGEDHVAELGEQLHAAETALGALEGDVDRALAASEGVDATTANTALVGARAAALLVASRFGEGRELLVALSARPMSEAQRAIIANNLAWADVNLGGEELLREADHWSGIAFEHLPREPAIIGTRARVLAELGRDTEALALVEQTLRRGSRHRREADRGESLATRAIVGLARGDALGARRDIDEAARLAPRSAGVDRIRARVDLRSLQLVSDAATVTADGRVCLPDALLSPDAGPTRAGASRALRSGDRDLVDAVLATGVVGTGAEGVDALSRTLGAAGDVASAVPRPSR